MDINTSVKKIKGVGDKTAEAFERIGIKTIEDLIYYYPRSYDQYEKAVDTSKIELNSKNAVIGTVKSYPKLLKFKGRSIVSFFVYDEHKVLEVRYFNSPYMAKAFKPGDKRVFRGYVKQFQDKIIIEQPKTYKLEEYNSLENTIVPIYPLTKDLTNDRLVKSLKSVLANIDFPADFINEASLNKMEMLSSNEAIKKIHFPLDANEQYFAKRRIIFGEFLDFYRVSKEGASKNDKLENSYKMIEVADCNRLRDSLPYKLTNAQNKAIADIFKDMSSDTLMNRLVQGDVGSGKTIISIFALLMCAANGYQGAMMAPTEVLARQHYENVKELSDKYKLCIKPALLTGKMPAKEKREALRQIEAGEVNVVIGTHALIQDTVTFNRLALVITDEQHRFGVRQREKLKEKGLEPHLLVMSATPIPRTLAMILFADLSVSIVDELPKNRIPISNCVVNSSFREKAYEKIRSEIEKGHQAYVICPMVNSNEEEELGLKSVEKHTKDIQEYFGEKYRVQGLNGKMKPDEKTRIMESFKDKNIDILVSTTVIEVGIDVPNATVILIENAERFGLSQLHQLRGRVGRGKDPSFCILLSDSKSEATKKRLNVLNETNDGFKIANEDMRLRGPGELSGVRQSGELQFGLGDIVDDGDLLILASEFYEENRETIPTLSSKIIDFRSI